MAFQDPTLARLLDNNAKWASAVSATDPGFFEATAKGQAPKVLWIGCADSRVPESVLLAARPGDIFVTRNIANQVHLTDDNILSVLTYAILEVGVEHVVVAGHTSCGGAAACMAASAEPPAEGQPTTPLGRWLAPLTGLARTTGVKGVDELVEASVRLQVENVLRSDIIKTAWSKDLNARGKAKLKAVHGWVYELNKGRVKDLSISVDEAGWISGAYA